MRYASSSLMILLVILQSACDSERPAASGPLKLAGGTCAACQVILTDVVVLGSPDDTTDLFFDARVTSLGDSGWMVAPTADGAGIAFYSSQGKAIGRVGRRGEGPGEFALISFTVLGRDGVITVFDPFRRRATELRRDGRVERTFALDHAARNPPVALEAGGFLVATAIPTSERAGMPLHLIDSSGAVRFSFGSETVPDGIVDGRLIDRAVRLAGDSVLWAAHRVNPLLEKWSLSGDLLDSVSYEVDWFPRQGPQASLTGRVRSVPLVSDFVIDSAGRILFLAQVEDTLTESRAESSTGLTAGDVASRRRTHLIVLSRSLEVAGYAVLPGYFSHFVITAPGLEPTHPMLVRVTADELGATRLVVSSLEVNGNL